MERPTGTCAYSEINNVKIVEAAASTTLLNTASFRIELEDNEPGKPILQYEQSTAIEQTVKARFELK